MGASSSSMNPKSAVHCCLQVLWSATQIILWGAHVLLQVFYVFCSLKTISFCLDFSVLEIPELIAVLISFVSNKDAPLTHWVQFATVTYLAQYGHKRSNQIYAGVQVYLFVGPCLLGNPTDQRHWGSSVDQIHHRIDCICLELLGEIRCIHIPRACSKIVLFMHSATPFWEGFRESSSLLQIPRFA